MGGRPILRADLNAAGGTSATLAGISAGVTQGIPERFACNNVVLSQLFLCLTRACLGKDSGFSLQNGQDVCLHTKLMTKMGRSISSASFSSSLRNVFFPTFAMFVPSLSWQIFGVYVA